MGHGVMEDFDNYQSITWSVEYPLIPKRDSFNNKWLWLKPTMKGIKLYQDPFPPEIYWVDREEFIMHKLKGTL